jgi:hypothetical protein
VVILQRLMSHGDDSLVLSLFCVFYCPAAVSEAKVVVSNCYSQQGSAGDVGKCAGGRFAREWMHGTSF